MTDYKINETDCKRLTAFLGKEWQYGSFGKVWNCTFTTPDDQHAVFKKLVEVGKWFEMYSFLISSYKKTLPDWILWKDVKDEHYYAWLWINPERFNKLVSLYLEEEK